MQMKNVLGVINLVNDKPFLKELTKHRCLASVPFAGRYRLIDFTLSNFIHSEITDVVVFTKAKHRSIMDHLGSGREWDLDRRNGGLHILPPVSPDKKVKGDLQQFHEHIQVFKQTKADLIVISPGHHVGKIDYSEAVDAHRKKQADITILYKDYEGEPVEKPIYHQCRMLRDGSLLDIDLFTAPLPGAHVCLETYILDKALFIKLVERCVEQEEYDFLKDVVKANQHKLNIQGYAFTGHLPFIHSNESYYKSNMDFLNPEIIHDYFYKQGEIYTKVKHEAPATYTATSNVSNSLVANGCEIEGTVENSVLFRGVKVHKGAVVKNSIIMQRGEIGVDVEIDGIIADKHVKLINEQKNTEAGKIHVIEKAAIR